MTKAGSAEMALGHAPGHPPGTIRGVGGAPRQQDVPGVIFALTLSGCLSVAPGGAVAHSKAEISPVEIDAIVTAIWHAEGAEKAVKPFGILSIPCAGYADCRRICRNTVRNNHRRWLAAGAEGDYLTFLAKRYCPVGASNDPQGLNRHWLKNVRYFLAKAAR